MFAHLELELLFLKWFLFIYLQVVIGSEFEEGKVYTCTSIFRVENSGISEIFCDLLFSYHNDYNAHHCYIVYIYWHLTNA